MNDIKELRRKFPVRGVSFEPGQGGLTRIVVQASDAEAHIYLHGAHVTHFQPRDAGEILFLSAKSHFEAGKPIRGGVPVIFPWFGPKFDDAKAPAHGFARTMEWEVADIRSGTDGAIAVTLELGASAATRALWPHEFRCRYTVLVGPWLELELEVQNLAPSAFIFEEALHTYLSVKDVRTVKIDGLAGREFLDKTDGARRKTQPAGPIAITAETDRVYVNTLDPVTVTDPALGRRLTVDKQGSRATVLWNPWVAKAKAMSDFGDEEWPAMLCIETANAAEDAVALNAGQKHLMKARLQTAPLQPQNTEQRTKQWEMTGPGKW